MSDEKTIPPLGTGSIDFNALHEAIEGGTEPAEALADATSRIEPLTEAEVAELPAVSASMLKARLTEIAADEEVTLDHLGDKPTNQEIVDAILMKRAAAPVVDEAGNLINPPPGNLDDEPSELGDGAGDTDTTE